MLIFEEFMNTKQQMMDQKNEDNLKVVNLNFRNNRILNYLYDIFLQLHRYQSLLLYEQTL